ncbi:MAG: GAF domain-containing protein [Fimbriimonadaceae bacterium]|nr:GAF domain-containing protein [Fimbriimonadaceae bacterium]
MRETVTRQMLDGANVARRAMLPGETDAILRSMLHASDEGVMLTDLDHTTLACNAKFGEIFELDPSAVVSMEPEQVRSMVYPKIRNPEEWRHQLMEIYQEPMRVYEDQIELLTTPAKVISRRTCPVLDLHGEIIGRIWTFRDVTKEHKRTRIQEALHQMSTFQHHDPAEVMKFLVNEISHFYGGSIAILSIKNGARMDFRYVAGMPDEYKHIKGNTVKDSYCRVAMKAAKPLFIQDGREHAAFKNIVPVKLGLTRYLGAPIFDDKSRPIGTICFLDGRSDTPVDEDDTRFMSLIAMRIGAELERERLVADRVAEQRAIVDQQRIDLQTTHDVLRAMNSGFQMLASSPNTDEILEGQVKLLRGLLGYSAAALLLVEDDELVGYAITSQDALPRRLSLWLNEEPALQSILQNAAFDAGTTMEFERQPSGTMGTELGCTYVGAAPLIIHGQPIALMVLGSHSVPPFADARHRMHVEAIVDQVTLLISGHILQRRLLQAHEELRNTQQRLIQSEKLSVAGTLSASIAHDIRNILSSLSLDLATSGSDLEETRQAVKVQIDRFNVLAHRLLSYARPRKTSHEECDLCELIEKVVDLTHAQTHIAGVDVTTELKEDSAFVVADVHQVEHLFVNLIMNAVQAMDAKGGHVSIRLSKANGFTVVEFEDSGKGIAKEHLAKLFEPFYTTRAEGFGLGLFSVRRIVEEHGWRIDVESKVGHGTTFRIFIPIPSTKN